jgi:N-methylhydantoinase A
MIGVDVGGTFTDVVSVLDGVITTAKVPTDTVETYRSVLAGADELELSRSTAFNHASTHGLNALITRRLPKVAFLTTLGHRDILDQGRVWRPWEALTDPSWRRPFGDAASPLVPRYLRRGIKERMTHTGDVLIPFDEDQAREELRVLARCNVEGVAICLINSYVDDSHEQRLGELLREELGDIPYSLSAQVSPLAKEYARASTTLIDVYMKIIYVDYVAKLDSGLRERGFTGDFNLADCTAGLMPAAVAVEQPFKVVFAGPAAGTVSSAYFARGMDVENVLCADVGGTSCDISVIADGEPFINTTFEIEPDLLVNTLSSEISSIGAGGGSIVAISPTGELLVGPESAGAEPGPACYGRGGLLPTTTDAYLLMGIIDPDTFARGKIKLDKDLALQAFEALDTVYSLEERIAYAHNTGLSNVAEGITNIAIRYGLDPRDFTLMAFGAAGPMLLPGVMDLVHVDQVVVPPHPGLFSALGLVSSDLHFATSRSAYTVLDTGAAEDIDEVFSGMEEELREQLSGQDPGLIKLTRVYDGRLLGQSWETPFVPVPGGRIGPEEVQEMIANFHDVYEKRAGHRWEAMPVQGVTYRVHATVVSSKVEYPELATRTSGQPTQTRVIDLHYAGAGVSQAAEYDRLTLLADDVIEGPAVIREETSTTYVRQGQTARIGSRGEITIRRG